MLNVLPQDATSEGEGHLGRAVVELGEGSLNGAGLRHERLLVQSSLQFSRKLACTQARQNHLPMRTLGEQAKDYRTAKGWNSAQMAKAVGTSRQSLEGLEEKGNRIPKYIANLAAVLCTTVDDMLAEAGLGVTPPRKRHAGAAGNWPLSPIVAREDYERLDDIEKGYVLGEMLRAIEKCKERRAAGSGNSSGSHGGANQRAAA